MAAALHQTDLLKGLNRLRLDGKYSDVTIRCGDRSFSCHRVVLAAVSDFFECMFDVEMQESLTREVDLTPYIVSEEMNICEKVLQFIYMGESAIDMSSAGHLLEIAKQFQMPSLEASCLKFLSTNLDQTNCLTVWQTAEAHGFAELEALALSLVKKHFQEVCYSNDFLSLCKIDYILTILNGQNMNCPDKRIICKAVMLWIIADFENRAVYIEEIMKALNVVPVDVDDVEAIISCDSFRDIREDSTYQSTIYSLKKARYSCQFAGSANQGLLSDESLVVIGGCEDGSNKDMQCFSFSQKKWFKLAALPFDVGFDFAVCSEGLNIFVSGGTSHKKVLLRYDGEMNKWDKMGEMPHGRQRHCMAIVRNTLYVLGGYDTAKSSPYQHIDLFDLATLRWVTGGRKHHMAIPVRSASCAVLGQIIYVVGGFDSRGNQISRVQYFNAKDKYSGEEYQVLPEEANSKYQAVVVSDKLYIVSKNGEVFQYDPGADHRPFVVGNISTFPRKDYGVCAFEGNILVLGGAVRFQPRTDMIQFNTVKKLTVVMQEVMPAPRSQFGLCKTQVIRRHLSNVDD
ncbi:kelch-like protein 24a [Ylistrum balloti]|uniref:kelch-like protein 24a n=1 Tax=Ylistrum balloti TaxID=509963 RepID=UPI002905DDC7|nr:kelch-like protein 24a [Ylistrum balloti]